ncbi:MAG: hypothetical protein U0R44_04920 [Candidatus Micrarchaeia archaeon]
MRIRMALFFLILTLLCFSRFQRPWENRSWVVSNPAIWNYGAEFWWNLPELHKTLESIDIASVEDAPIGGASAGDVKNAREAIDLARMARDRCYTDIIIALNIFPLAPSNLFLSVFSRSSGCVAYGYYWRSSVDNALLAVEHSMEESSRAVADAKDSYDQLIFDGLCEDDYTGPGSASCPELGAAFTSVGGNISEGGFGKFQAALDRSSLLSRALWGAVPDLRLSMAIVGLSWAEDGIIRQFDHVKAQAVKSIIDGEKEYLIRIGQAEGRKKEASGAISELDSQHISVMDKAVADSDTPGSVSERFDQIKKKERQAGSNLTEAKLRHGDKNRKGYLAQSISLASESGNSYSELVSEIRVVRAMAESLLGQQKTEALDELRKLSRLNTSAIQDPKASSYFLEANESFEEGERGSILGDRYYAYKKAADLARAGQNVRPVEDLIGSLSSTAKLEDLIKRAGKDEINVFEENEILKFLKSGAGADSSGAAAGAESSIISKARIKYGDSLSGKRKRIIEKLSLAGKGAQDLLTDLERYESGIVEDGSLLYPDSIGSLKKLERDYVLLESEIDDYEKEIAGNSVSGSATPLITGVWLDQPADVTLDIILANSHDFNATSIEAEIRLQTPLDLFYSDIVSGKENVDSVRSADGGRTLVLSVPSIRPYETKHVVFKKSIILAHTLKKDQDAEGVGQGSASVKERTEFELDADIGALDLPRGQQDSLIDGKSGDLPLVRGKHIITLDRIEENAYVEETRDIHVYSVGVNSRVEYDERILPALDLDSVPVFLNSLNGSEIKAIEVFSSTGESLTDKEQISQSQYFVRVHGLRKGKPTILKISYLIEGTENFVKKQLALLDASNLNGSAKDIVAKAKIQAMDGDFSGALGLIEKAVAASAQDEKEMRKLNESKEKTIRQIQDEITAIGNALSGSDIPDPFIDKLSARKSELERVFGEIGSGIGNATLADYDEKWLDKEVSDFLKKSSARYNLLRERFYQAGNSSTPGFFSDVEERINQLASGRRLEYVIPLIKELALASEGVEIQELSTATMKNESKNRLEELAASLTAALDDYSSQASAAKGTEYSNLFQENEKELNRLIKDAGAALDKDPRLLSSKMEEMNRSRDRIISALANLKSECDLKVSLMEEELKRLEYDTQPQYSDKLRSIRSMASSGNYINALRAASSLKKEIEGKKPSDTNMLVIGLTGVALLAGVGFLVFRPKDEKKIRKLSSLSDFTGKSLPEASDHRSRT